MSRYIDEHRTSFGVEPICRTLAIAPSSYYAAKSDHQLRLEISTVHAANFGVYASASCGTSSLGEGP